MKQTQNVGLDSKTSPVATKRQTVASKKSRGARRFERAANRLEGQIRRGRIKPGEKLPSESELQETFDLSRASVREALRTLESKGLIEVRTGAGAYVSVAPTTLTVKGQSLCWLLGHRDLLIQFLEVREFIEALSASRAAQLASPSILTDLGEIIRKESALLHCQDVTEAQVRLDVQFHVLIAQACGNHVAEELISTIVHGMAGCNKAIRCLSGNSGISLEEHRRIVQAIAAQDSQAAERAMRSHISRVREEMMDYGLDR